MTSRIDSILEDTGLSGHGGTILEYALEYGVNPAFALATFRKEAEFAKQGSIAQRQNNPGDIICGGGTTPLYGATGCGGRFGTYDTMADGIKAYFWLLDTEYKPGRKYDCEDINCIISVYCPPSDCDTARYVEQVVDWTTQYQSLLSAGGPLVLEPGPTVPSIAVTIVPATVSPESPAATASPMPAALVQGRIAFISYLDGNSDVYAMNADGSAVTNLTKDPAQDVDPTWSPDGQRIAFASDRVGNYEIYVMNADGSGVIRLTNELATDWEPSWSPDGQQITFVSLRDGDFDIYVMDMDGTGVTNLTNNSVLDTAPRWSPDGKRIVFMQNPDRNADIYTMRADGTDVRCLTHTVGYDGDPSWSPDGTRIAFTSDGEIHTMNADGSGIAQLTVDEASDCCASWSPDGNQLVFVSDRGRNFNIWVMNSDGSQQAMLNRTPVYDGDPAWSPR